MIRTEKTAKYVLTFLFTNTQTIKVVIIKYVHSLFCSNHTLATPTEKALSFIQISVTIWQIVYTVESCEFEVQGPRYFISLY